jgi:Rps23 Pro-64 3,4-dihydroxylase Tpa1-like proline 4-hydroxylase
MTSKQIINDVANSKEYVKLCKTIAKDYSDDLFQDLIVILCEYNPEKLEQINTNGHLKWFIVRILKNQFNSATSPFYKTNKEFLDRTSQIDFSRIDLIDEEYDSSKDSLIEMCLKELDITNCTKDQYYERMMFKEYIEAGSCDKLSKKTGIYRKSIQYTVKKVKEEIKVKYDISTHNIGAILPVHNNR